LDRRAVNRQTRADQRDFMHIDSSRGNLMYNSIHLLLRLTIFLYKLYLKAKESACFKPFEFSAFVISLVSIIHV